MAEFLDSYRLTAKNEGLYANNRNDKGKETYAGISRKYWPSWKGWAIIDKIKAEHGTTAAIINKYASVDDVLKGYELEFYKTNFWYPNNLNLINDQQVANNVYDFGVNAGVGTAAKMLQKAANSLCNGLVVDGVIGKGTIASVNKLNGKALYDAFNIGKKKYYDGIIEADPSQAEFRASWYSRIKPYKV